jgi:septal ring factor EnvC (AmiA/AmiB activator)
MKALLALGLLTAATALAAPALDPRERLAGAKAEAVAARQRAAFYQAQVKLASDGAERARRAQSVAAARVQATEAEVAAAEARLELLRARQQERARRLAERQRPIVELVAALQTMARRPAAAALVQPGSLNDAVHLRAVLATMAPAIRTRTAALRSDLAAAGTARAEAERGVLALRQRRQEAAGEAQRLASLEAQQRQLLASATSTARQEAGRASELAQSSRSLETFVRQLDRSRRRGRLLNAEARPGLAYRLPAAGPVLAGFGEPMPSGGSSRGATIAARPGALVVAPAPGRIAFAGLYRNYGAIAIIDHGGGQVSLVTGLASNIARIGDVVASGGPLGRAGANGVTVELRQDGRPVDFKPLVG